MEPDLRLSLKDYRQNTTFSECGPAAGHDPQAQHACEEGRDAWIATATLRLGSRMVRPRGSAYLFPSNFDF